MRSTENLPLIKGLRIGHESLSFGFGIGELVGHKAGAFRVRMFDSHRHA
jgi:hypothetical protein